MSDALICDQASCPLLADGRCLEGIVPPEDCPHATFTYEHSDEIAVSAASSVTEDDGLEIEISESRDVGKESVNKVLGDKALTMSAANDILAERPCVIVLVAGEADAGKTTLLAQLWAQFLIGPFSGWDFAGSLTLLALSELHATARASSGLLAPDTVRTRAEEPHLLHLAVRNGSGRTDLLLSDVRGEYFEPVLNGQVLGDKLPLASRADCCVVLLSGEMYSNRGKRARAISRARQLLGGLTVEGGLRPGIPVLLAWSKADLIEEGQRDEALGLLQNLASGFASRVSISFQLISARPELGPPIGLETALHQFVDSAKFEPTPSTYLADQPSDREFWRSRGSEVGE